MKFDLAINESLREIVTNLIESKGIKLDKTSPYKIVQRGMEQGTGLEILFDMDNVNLLLDILEKFTDKKGENTKSIVGKRNESYEILDFSDVIYIEAEGNNVYCKTDKAIYKLKDKLYELEEKLKNERFIRISKSTIVNIMNVSEIIPYFGGKLLLKFGTTSIEKEVSRSFVKDFKEYLGI